MRVTPVDRMDRLTKWLRVLCGRQGMERGERIGARDEGGGVGLGNLGAAGSVRVTVRRRARLTEQEPATWNRG